MCITRKPEMSREEFKDYWMNQHGPYFMSNADAMGAKKYVQSHTLDTPLNDGLRTSRGMLPEYDGVAEVWFESEEALMERMTSPEGQKLGAAFRFALLLRLVRVRSLEFRRHRLLPCSVLPAQRQHCSW